MKHHRCIYCMVEKPLSGFSTDHVMPRAFGTFEGNSPTLRKEVCAACNHRMGREIEDIVARGSIEGFLRFMNGMPPSKSIRHLDQARVRLTLPGPPGYRGIRVELAPSGDGHRYVAELPTQLCFKSDAAAKWECRTLREIQRDPHCVDGLPREHYAAFGHAGQSEEEAIAAFVELGIPFNRGKRLAPPLKSGETTSVLITSIYDELVDRMMAKIAFNFLTHQRGAAVTLRPDFNPIREFVLYGAKPSTRPVQVSHGPMLMGETQATRITDGHLVTSSMNGDHLIGSVSPFNATKYHVLLAENYTGIALPPTGKCFDWRAGRVKSLSKPIFLL